MAQNYQKNTPRGLDKTKRAPKIGRLAMYILAIKEAILDMFRSDRIRDSLNQLLDTAQTECEEMLAEKSKQDGAKRVYVPRKKSSILPFKTVILQLIISQSKSLYGEMTSSLLFSHDHIPTVSAFVQRLKLIHEDVFYHLFTGFVEENYWNHINIYEDRFYGVDGTSKTYPGTIYEESYHVSPGKENAKEHNEMHGNALYSLNEHMFLDIIIQPVHEKDERDALLTFMDRVAHRFESSYEARTHSIFVDDRGYESWAVIARACKHDLGLICRCKDPDSNGLLAGIRDLLPENYKDLEWMDTTLDVTLTRSAKRKFLSNYVYLNTNQRCDECTPDQDFAVTLRVVKVPLSKTTSEYMVVINLNPRIYTAKVLKSKYFLRWGLEIGFMGLKEACCLNSPHGLSSESIRKEFIAKLILYDISACFAYYKMPSESTLKLTPKTKHEYEVTFSDTVADVRRYLAVNENYDLDEIVQKHRRPVRPDRPSKPRVKRAKLTPYTNHKSS